MTEKPKVCDWPWFELNAMRENCLGYLEDIISLLMVTHGANGSRRDQTQTNTANAMSLVADKDTHITNFALNQTLYPDGQTDVNTEIEKRVDSLRSKEIRILIAGEVATGKSTLMNVLMGGPYLPTDHFHCTAVVCELHLSLERKAYIFFRDDDKPPLSIDNLSINPDENTQPNKHGTGWEQVWYYIKESPETQDILRVELYWPMPFIKHLLTLRPTMETHLRGRHEGMTNERDDDSSWQYQPRLRELKLSYERSPGDGKSSSGSFREGKPDTKMIAAKYHLHSPNVLPTILYEREGPMSSNIERSHNNDTDETIPKLVAMDNHIGSEETIPKRVYSSIDDLPVGMTAEHYQHIDVNVIVSHDAGQKTTDMKTNNHSSLDAYGSVIVDDDAGKPNKFINGNASTCSEGSAENRSRRSDGTFSAGVDEAPEVVNIVFCDCPGITENEQTFEPTLENVDKSHGIILVVDAMKANAGIEERKVLKLLHRLQERLHNQGVMLHHTPLLCICNKMDMIDDRTKQGVKNTVRKIVDDTFPTIQDVPVRFFGARKLLEEPTACQKITNEVQSFLKQSFHSELLTEHIWMMNLLDLTMTIRKEKGKLAHKLRNHDSDTCKDAIQLLQKVNDMQTSTHKIQSCKNEMEKCLLRSKSDFKFNWSSDEVDELVQKRHASWDSICNAIDNEIFRKLHQKIEEDEQLSEFRSLKNKYLKLKKDIFKPYLAELDRLKKAAGMHDNNHSLLQDLGAPVGAPATAIVASRFIPHHGMAVVAPLAGLLLIGIGAFEEFRDWQDDQEKARFERDKLGYMKCRTSRKIKELLRDLSVEDDKKRFSNKSNIYRAIFGDSIRKHIIDELSSIIQHCLSGKTIVSQMKQKPEHVTDVDIEKLFNKFQEIYTSFITLSGLQTTSGDHVGTEVLQFGDYSRMMYQQESEPVFEVEKSCTTMECGTESAKQLQICKEYLSCCCQTSRGLQHNILSLKDARVLNISDASPKLCLIYEDCQSSLEQFIANNPLARGNGRRRKQETEFFKLGVQLVQAIHYLHSRGICHGNLNPGNILLDESHGDMTVKMGGPIGVLKPAWLYTEDNCYVAPELTDQRNISSSKQSDICSVGFILLELWYRNTVENLRKSGIDINKISDRNVRAILRGCLQEDPRQRWTSHTLLDMFK